MRATARATSASRSPRPSPLQGPDALEAELESLLNLAIDDVEVVDAARLAALLDPVGPIEVELAADVTDADGEVVAEAGPTTLDAGRGGGDPDRTRPDGAGARPVPGGDRRVVGRWPRRSATGSAGRPARRRGRSTRSMGDLTAGAVGARGLRAAQADADQNPRGVDVSLLDQAE